MVIFNKTCGESDGNVTIMNLIEDDTKEMSHDLQSRLRKYSYLFLINNSYLFLINI